MPRRKHSGHSLIPGGQPMRKYMADDSFHPVMRLLLPRLDTERQAYGIKEHTLAKLYIDILGLGKESLDAKKLLNYRTPHSAASSDSTGDFGSVAYFILNNRCPAASTVTIAEVNNRLDAISHANSCKNKEAVKKNLLYLLKNLTAVEQKWLIRIIMKELKLGLNQSSIFGVFHPDADDLYNVTTNLKKLCQELHDPRQRLNEIEISLFSPFRPMLADRIAISNVQQTLLQNNEDAHFLIETKLDGERVQLHKGGEEFKYFSRGSKDFTSSYGRSPFEGPLTPHISKAFKTHVKSCILDGEMMMYHPVHKCFVSKGSGEGGDVKHMDVPSTSEEVQTGEGAESRLQQAFCAFDLLMLNDLTLSNQPLHHRLKLLREVFEPIPGRFEFVASRMAKTNMEVLGALNEAIDGREEGIIVKHPHSVYKPDKRHHSGWFKIKPDYDGTVMSDLDLLIVGGYFGTGRRANLLSHFMLALASDCEPTSNPSHFFTLTKIGSGYTDRELISLNKLLAPSWQKSQPSSVLSGSERPDVWVEPSKSVVVQVRAAEITKSDKYKYGFTLRFPRLEKIRADKLWYQVIDETGLNKLRQEAEGKLATKHASILEDSMGPGPKKKLKKIPRRDQRLGVDHRFISNIDAKSIQKGTDLFEGREFCIVNVPCQASKQELESRVISLGGEITQHPSNDTFCVLVDKLNVRVNSMIKASRYDIISISWLLRCLETTSLLPWKPNEIIYISPETKELFSREYDDYGDSYTEATDPESLREVFEKMENDPQIFVPRLEPSTIDLLKKTHFVPDFPANSKLTCQGVRAFFFGFHEEDDAQIRLAKCQIQNRGGDISTSLNDSVNYVISKLGNPPDVSHLPAISCQTVGLDWLTSRTK